MVEKFMTRLLFILASVLLLSLFVNRNFIERYFLYQEKKDLNRICDSFMADGDNSKERIGAVEEAENVVIAVVENSADNIRLNEQLKQAFLDKGVSLKKYWLWDQDQQSAQEDGRSMRIYNQEKLNYSLLAIYFPMGSDFVAVGKLIPSVSSTLSLVNTVTALIFVAAGAVMLLLIFILVKRITKPLKEIGETANAIAALDFRTLSLHTGDELEVLAEDINRMSAQLKETHHELEEKNRQMEELLSNVSHDLKTPIALIKAYTCGMKDGMDDGSFLDTVIAQNLRMEQMTERLLSLSRMKRQECAPEEVDLSSCLREQTGEYRIHEASRKDSEEQNGPKGAQGISMDCRIAEEAVILGNKEAIDMIFLNMISNAVKYSADGFIKIELSEEQNHFVFRIENRLSKACDIDLSRLWEPFYVAEQSRNKERSGTGLGLAIVSAAAEKYGYKYSCAIEEESIRFEIIF